MKSYQRKRRPRPRAPKPVSFADDDLSLVLIGLRKHTRAMMRRYVFARYQAARIHCCLDRRLGPRADCRPIRSFEDALLFVIDMDRCIDSLRVEDQKLIQRMLVQEYTAEEVGAMSGVASRTVGYRFPLAIDRLTQKLIDSGLLIVPDFMQAVA